MRIKPISDEQASPEAARMLEALASVGKATPLFRMLAYKPAVLRAFTQLEGALWAEDSQLPARLKDLAYLRVSILNGCEY